MDLVVPVHPRSREKFPVIDIHSHQPAPISAADFDRVVAGMEKNNLRLLVNLSGGTRDRLKAALEAIRASRIPGPHGALRQRRLSRRGSRVWRQGGGPARAGHRGGRQGAEDLKDLGLRIRRTDGQMLTLDDPELDPIWAVCGRLNVPVLIHTAEPAEFFEPITYQNERWLELALFSNRRYPTDQAPRFEELMGERDRMFARHPKTRFIAAHFAYHANDLARLAALLDRLPNVYPEVAAILAELGRQPRAAHEFFVKYQDRVLFGKDSYQPDEYPYYWRTFETGDEYIRLLPRLPRVLEALRHEPP